MEMNMMELWKSQNEKLDQVLLLNKQLLYENLEQKTHKTLSRLRAIRWVGIIIGVLWSIGVAFVLIVSWANTNWFFKSAFIIHLLITGSAIGLYFKHLFLLQKLDKSKSIVESQKALIDLFQSNLHTLGLLWLQLPVFSMWYMSDQWMLESPNTFWYIQLPAVVLQLFIGIWLYQNLNYKNHDKKWFKWFVSKGEFGKIQQAQELLKEMDTL